MAVPWSLASARPGMAHETVLGERTEVFMLDFNEVGLPAARRAFSSYRASIHGRVSHGR